MQGVAANKYTFASCLFLPAKDSQFVQRISNA